MRDSQVVMRTTLDVDDDVLQAAREIAANRGTTIGMALSELARKGLGRARGGGVRNGVPLMPRRRKGSPRPTLDTVNRLRDEP
jgi:hypothetical protein